MARTRKRTPYDPSKGDLAEYQQRVREAEEAKKRDRKSRDLLRNARVAALEADDPISGDKIIVLRSLRDDPLARLHDRRQIDQAQYEGARAFQRDFEAAERGPRAIDPGKEYVDGGMAPEPITESMRKAARRLAGVNRELGQNGSALVYAVLIDRVTIDRICDDRGLKAERERLYVGRRFRECLDDLAKFYGFVMEGR